MQSQPSQSEDPIVRQAWGIVVDAAREAYLGHRACEIHGAGCDNECDPDARYEFDCEDEWR